MTKEAKKKPEKTNLATIKTAPTLPIQDVLCRKEHVKLFQALCGIKQKL